MSTLKIIDVSRHNGTIAWDKVAKQVDGVIIRAGYRSVGGAVTKDPMCLSYLNGAIAAGVKRVGVYWWTTHTTTGQAKIDAQFVLGLLKPYKKYINFGVWLDSEKSSKPSAFNKLSASTRTSCALAFLSTIEREGYVAGVYASDSWYGTHLNMAKLSKYPFWVAKYSTISPKVVKKYAAWQYTSKGKVDGMSGNVDVSKFYEDFATVKTGPVPAEPESDKKDGTPAEDTKPVDKNTEKKPYSVGRTYTLLANMNVRSGPGATYAVKNVKSLTSDGRRNAVPGLDKAVLKSGTKVTCKDVSILSNGAIWMKIPSGWICAKSCAGKVYVK